MERLTGDVSGGDGSIVPAAASMQTANAGAPVPNVAGVNPTPMAVDQGFFHQPVQAYFQFVQNNLTYIKEGNIDAFRREAKERHAQVMEHKVQQLNQEFEQVCFGELAQQRADAENRLEQMTAELTGFAMSRTAAEQEVMKLRKELSDANAKLKNAANAVALEAEQRANQKVSHLAAQYETRYSELRTNLEADCKRIVDETVDYARKGMEEFKHEEHSMVKEMREECNRQEAKAADLNFQLQERVDELMEQLNKYSAPEIKIQEADESQDGVQLEFATRKSASVPAGATSMPNTAMADLAADAKEKLHSLFSTTPARSAVPPKLPNLPLPRQQDENLNQEPSVRSPTIAASEPDKLKGTDVVGSLSGQQLLDLITRLTAKDSDGEKPRIKRGRDY